MLPAPRRGGGAAGLCPAAGPLPGLARQRARSSQRSLCVAAKAASFNSLAHWASASLLPPLAALGSAPGVSAPTFLLPMSNRRNAGGGALAQGRRETLGYAGGGGVWQAEGRPCGPPLGRQKNERPRGRSFRARSAQPPPPLGRWLFSVLSGKAPVLSLQFPANKTSPPLPMSGGPAYSVGNQKKFSSWFSPAFFKSGRGAEPSAASGGRSEAEAQ